MPVAKVSSKGQVTLPAECRRATGIKLKSRVFIEAVEGGIRITPAPGILSLRGFLGKGGSPEEEETAMQKAVARHVLGKE
ncbi:MAG TPA: AbrB/MazE/SpoVT family DNA-binding domain-containing protein [Planctomycetota bacterium]|nr:AbrB/MazE/SpoVT family DNA-binding domain-containing protein [Planctomycetota bacterium]HRR79846.1 AbrB/MazE/SpoVT family DNA-binding domain-containing protein [Planctomycetota bacterium]HRT92922.1 AbrB/MazE/SpoVT family DNA-binding domain-containing protein [Planctomycetota bacterium]